MMSHFPPIRDRKIRFALMGCGRISANRFAAIEKHAKRAELVAVCDVDPAALDNAAKRTRAAGFNKLTGLLTKLDFLGL